MLPTLPTLPEDTEQIDKVLFAIVIDANNGDARKL